MLIALNGWWDDYFFATLIVVQMFIFSLILSVVLGLIGASAKLSSKRFVRFLGESYTIIFRGVPEILVLLIIYFGSAELLKAFVHIYDPSVKFIDIPPFWAAIIAIGLIVGSYMTETFRGAFLGVNRGQVEAAKALGLSRWMVFFYVKLPQMWRLALPNLGNHMLSIMKDTALVSILGIEEILYVAELAGPTTQQPFTMYFVVAIIYLILTAILTQSVNKLEYYSNKHLRG